ncbi:MAG: Gfo/Idh/MocA family protein [bacterium]
MTIRAGVAGAGVFGGYHANKYKEATAAKLTAIFDPDPERAAMAAEMHGCAGLTDFDHFLTQIDALTIAAPASFHYQLAIKALQAGKHCLIEKPIALASAHAEELVDLATEKKLILQIGHQERYVFEAFGLLSRPDRPIEVHSRRLNKFSGRAMDVSVVFDLMIHDLDLLNQIVDAPVSAIQADGRCEHGEKSDHTETQISFADGTKAYLAASRLVEEPIRDMRLIYEDGEIVINFLKREITNTTSTPLAMEFGQELAPLSFADPLAYGTQSFLAAIHAATPPIVTGEDGKAALELALKIEQKSMETTG